MESDSSPIFLFVALALLVLIYSFFISALSAIVRSRSSQLCPEGETPGRTARMAEGILERAEHFALVVQIGKFLSGMLLGVCLVEILRGTELYQFSAAISEDYRKAVYGLLLFMGGAVLTTFALIAVQTAKAVAAAHPERVLLAITHPLVVVEWFVRPFAVLLHLVVSQFLKLANVPEARERELPVSTEEISEIVERSTLAGEMEIDDGELLRGVVSFSDTLVREVMTPRADIVSVSIDSTLDEIMGVFLGEGLSRLLVVGNGLDDVRGVILAKDLIPLFKSKPEDFEIERYLRRPHYVMESHPVDEVLKYFKLHANHFAVVHDEHGGTSGIVTMEDLIEEIVGDIFDEFDHPDEEQEVYRARNGDLLVDGSMLIEDLNEEFDTSFPEGEYDTIAGFVIAQLGRIPRKGESIDFENFTLTVEQRQENRVTLVRVAGAVRTPDASNAA